MGFTATFDKGNKSSTTATHSGFTDDGLPSFATHHTARGRKNELHGGLCITFFHRIPGFNKFSHGISLSISPPAECILDRIPFPEKANWARLINAVNRDTNAGVVETTRKTRQRYWRHWVDFLPSGFDPYLQNVDAAQQLVVLQVFAMRAREGTFGRGKRVQTGSVQAAIGAVAKTIELAGRPNPLHKPGTTNYHAALAMQTEGYRRADPEPNKQMAVPVRVPNRVFSSTRDTKDPKLKAIGELVLIAFYFLLRVGEYTYHNTQRRTQQFRLRDMKFFANQQLISIDQLEANADRINLVSLTIENQKNGRKGDILSQHALRKGDTACCPVKAVVARAVDMVRMKATDDTLICAFRASVSLPWQQIRSSHIVDAVKEAVKGLRLTGEAGFKISKIGSHSLRAGGAMALYLNKKSALEIQRAGRWTSNTFMEYIHCQLDVSSKGLSQAMSNDIPFMNMAR